MITILLKFISVTNREIDKQNSCVTDIDSHFLIFSSVKDFQERFEFVLVLGIVNCAGQKAVSENLIGSCFLLQNWIFRMSYTPVSKKLSPKWLFAPWLEPIIRHSSSKYYVIYIINRVPEVVLWEEQSLDISLPKLLCLACIHAEFDIWTFPAKVLLDEQEWWNPCTTHC